MPDAFRPPSEEQGKSELAPVLSWFGGGRTLDLTDDLAPDQLRERLEAVPGLEKLCQRRLGTTDGDETAAAMEFVVEALHQGSLLAKEELVGGRVYRDAFEEMVRSFNS